MLGPTCCPYGWQLSNRESLRDVVLATQAHASKAYHLGFGRHAAKSTLANANMKRDYRIFEEFAYKVISKAHGCLIVDIFKLNGDVYAFDSTTGTTTTSSVFTTLKALEPTS